MNVSCVLTAHELIGVDADVVVFPEGICGQELHKTQISHPAALIVAAIVEDARCHGVLLHRGGNRIQYCKIGSDGRTVGTENLRQRPVYDYGDVCVGVEICMDVNIPTFIQAVIDGIRSSPAGLKLLCIPADMDANWFVGDTVSPQVFTGIHVVLCNHTKTYPEVRCRSFITDTHCNKIIVQRGREPIHAQLSTRFA